MTRHNNEVHEEKPFDCKKCDRSYTSERALKAHNNSVHAKKESIKQIYKCDLCYSDFKTKDELEKHQTKVDKGNKVYQCSICRACFLSKRGLKNHVKNSHTDLTKYKCNNEIANMSHVCNINHVDNSALKKQLPALKKSTCLNMPSSISIATKCHDCDTNYLDNSALKVHLALEHGPNLNVHEEEKPFRCEKCKTSYKLKGSLTRHNNLVHEGKDTKEKAIKQKLQKKDMKEEQKKIVHEAKDTKEKAIKQKQKKDMKEEQKKIVHEGKDTKEKAIRQKQKKDVKEEQKKIIKEAKEPIVIFEHGQNFDEENRNEIANQQEQKQKFRCEKCQFNFLSLKSLRNHFNNIHIPQKCKKCDKHFPKEDLQRHIETVHEEKTKCKKEKKRELQQENDNDMKQTKKIKGSHSCPVCKEFFESQSIKIKHIASMHPEKLLFRCHYCQKVFDREFNCKQHISNIHEQKKPFHCKICNKDFFQERGLKKHNAVVHEGKDIYQKEENDMNDENEKNVKQEKRKDMKQKEKITFQCKICSIRFEQESQLKEHMINNHEGKKPFHCEICNRGFVQHNLLKKHMKIHEDSKPQQVNNTNQASNDIQYEVDDKEQSFVAKYRVEGNLEDYKDSGDPGDSGDSGSLGDWESFGSDFSPTFSEIDFLIKESE